MASAISDTDRALVTQLREKLGVLVDIDLRFFHHETGFVLVSCGDCDELPELLLFIQRERSGVSERPLPHLLTRNGGALLIADRSPFTGKAIRRNYITEIFESCTLKGISGICLQAHVPCGKAGTKNLSVLDIIQLLHEAQIEVELGAEKRSQSVTVQCILHVDKGGENKRAYEISLKAWEKYRQL